MVQLSPSERIYFVMPAYNEAENIEEIVEKWLSHSRKMWFRVSFGNCK